MAKKSVSIADQLKQAILASGMSRYRISQLSGVSEGQLSRFVMNRDDPRHRTLTLESAARVAVVLGLQLSPKKKGR